MSLIKKELMEILVCPVDKSELVEETETSELRCLECGRLYPVRDGIPVMLVDESRIPSDSNSADNA